jgi:hypothetical protein
MADPSLIDSLNALAAKLDALLVEARATRELLQASRAPVHAEAIPTIEAAQVRGCSIRRVEQLLRSGVLDRGHRYGKRGTVTVASVERAMRTAESAGPRTRRAAEPERGWKPIDRGPPSMNLHRPAVC